MKSSFRRWLIGLAVPLVALAGSASFAPNVQASAPFKIKHVTASGTIHVKQQALKPPTAHASGTYSFCGPAGYAWPAYSGCLTVYTSGDASGSYLHTGNASEWWARSANWGCGQCTIMWHAISQIDPGGGHNMWPVPQTASTYRVSNNNVYPWVYWIRPDTRMTCWYGTNVIGSDYSMSIGSSQISWACGAY